MSSDPKRLVASGFAIGLSELTGLEFTTNANYTYCRICGDVFQSDLDRSNAIVQREIDDLTETTHNRPVGEVLERIRKLQMLQTTATEMRRTWSKTHARTHTDLEHQMLDFSSNWLTPEAAHKLAAFGVIPVTDMVLDEGVESALKESSSVPQDDAEG